MDADLGASDANKGKPAAAPAAGTTARGDNVLPAYCNPPNPCPIGYTGNLEIIGILHFQLCRFHPSITERHREE